MKLLSSRLLFQSCSKLLLDKHLIGRVNFIGCCVASKGSKFRLAAVCHLMEASVGPNCPLLLAISADECL